MIERRRKTSLRAVERDRPSYARSLPLPGSDADTKPGRAKALVPSWNSLFLVTFVFCFLALLRSLATTSSGAWLSPWVVTDWLINYEGGMVRRGLAGSLLLAAAKQLNVAPQTLLLDVIFVLQLTLLIAFTRAVNRARHLLSRTSMALLLFLPVLALFPFLDVAAFGRKEVLFFFLTIAHLWAAQSCCRDLPADTAAAAALIGERVPTYARRAFAVSLLLGVPIVLSHEAAVFLVVPANVLLTSRLLAYRYSRRGAWLGTLAIFTPVLLAFLFSVIYKGDANTAAGICASLVGYGAVDCSSGPPLAIDALTWSTGFSITRTVERYFGDGQALTYTTGFFVLAASYGAALYAVTRNFVTRSYGYFRIDSGLTARGTANRVFLMYAILPAVLAAPLFLLAVDWGRWLYVLSLNYVFLLLSPSLVLAESYGAARDRAAASLLRITATRSWPGKAQAFLVAHKTPVAIAVVYLVGFTMMPHMIFQPNGLTHGLIARMLHVLGVAAS